MDHSFGDRMKAYEAEFTSAALNPALPIYARLDGRSFSNLTKGLKRPYDERFSRAMIDTTKYLVENTHAIIGYTQSDEISLAWHFNPPSVPMFDGKIQKLSSVLASMTAAAFMNALIKNGLKKLLEKTPHFDCRVLNLPNRSEATNMFMFRAQDANRNAINMAAADNFSPKTLQGVSTALRLNMLSEIGINFEDYPDFFKLGTFVRREVREIEITAEMLSGTNAPDTMIGTRSLRSFTEVLDMPRFGLVKNRVNVIFDGAQPLTGWS